MGFESRLAIYSQIEAHRHKPLIVYVTSTRPNAPGIIGQDAIAELLEQLERLPVNTTNLDFMVVSNGGDPSVAWRIVSLIRERVEAFSILVPQAAYSAATMMALGANEIVMHPNGNLGPTDLQLINQKKQVTFGTEDLQAFLKFVRKEVGLTDQVPVRELFQKFCEEVGFTAVGMAARGSQLSTTMGEKMLRLHMKEDGEGKKSPRAIAEAMNSNYFHHGYPVGRKEARAAGLPITEDQPLESMIWSAWRDVETELEIRRPFLALDLFRNDPNGANLFAPIPQLALPVNSNQMIIQMAMQNFMQLVVQHAVPPVRYSLVNGIMESTRYASRSSVSGSVFAARQHDLQIQINMVAEKAGWSEVPLPAPQVAVPTMPTQPVGES